MKSNLLFIFLLTSFTATLFAQEGELSLHLFGCAPLPYGDFGKDITDNTGMTRRSGFDVGDKIGLAQTGYGAGVELNFPVWFKGLQWVISSKILLNGVDSEAVQDKYRAQLRDTIDVGLEDVNLEFGRWINIPVLTGFRYDHHFSHRYSLYGILQAGVNLSKAPSKKAMVKKVTAENTNYKTELITAEEATYELTRDFGIEFGFGFVFDQTYALGFRYLALSTPRYDGTRKLSEQVFPEIFSREGEILGEERSISMFVVTLGIQLFR